MRQTVIAALVGGTAACAGLVYVVAKLKKKNLRSSGRPEERARKDVSQAETDLSSAPDVIIIGSGLGSLLCGALLARKSGVRCAVYEKHDVPGGAVHVFYDQGVQFQSAAHAVPGFAKGSLLRAVIDHILGPRLSWPEEEGPRGLEPHDVITTSNDGLSNCLRLCGLSPSGAAVMVDDIVATNKGLATREEIDAGVQRLLVGLQDAAACDRVMALVRSLPPLFARFVMWIYWRRLAPTRVAAATALADLDLPLPLQRALDFPRVCGVGSADVSWWVYASSIRCAFEGRGGSDSSWPLGGMSAIVNAAVAAIEDAGGRVEYRSEVKEVLVDGGKVVGVKVHSGGKVKEVRAKRVVCGAQAAVLQQSLLSDSYGPVCGLTKADYAEGVMTAFVSLKGSPEELRLPRYHTWDVPCGGLDVAQANAGHDSDSMDCERSPMLMTFPHTREGQVQLAESPTGAVVVFETPHGWCTSLRPAGSQGPVRGPHYRELKAEIAEVVEERLLLRFPQLEDRIMKVTVGTPITSEHYLGTAPSASGGVIWSPSMFRSCHSLSAYGARCRLEGLFLTGQDVWSRGALGSMISALVTAAAVSHDWSVLDPLRTPVRV